MLTRWARLPREPTEVFVFSYWQHICFFGSAVAGTAGSCGNARPKSEKDFSSSSYPQSTCRWLLHRQPRIRHRGKAWKSTQKKVLTHNAAPLPPFIAQPQNAKPADRIPQTALHSDSRLLSLAAYRNNSHTPPAFPWYKTLLLTPTDRQTDGRLVHPC